MSVSGAQYFYAQKANTLAPIALVLSFLGGLGGIVCGHISLSQIRRRNESGKLFAIFALVFGYINFIGLLGIAALYLYVQWVFSPRQHLEGATSDHALLLLQPNELVPSVFHVLF